MHSDEWMTDLESLQNEIDEIGVSTKMSDKNFVVRALNNLTVYAKREQFK